MYEAEVLQSLAILLLELSPELCTIEKLQAFFETLFVGTPAANIKEIHINSTVAINDNSNDTKVNISSISSAQTANKEEADGDEVAVVLFYTTEATRHVLEKVEVVSSGSAYNLELRRGYLELNKERVLVEGVLSVSANTSASSSSSSIVDVKTEAIPPIVTQLMNSNDSNNITKTSTETKQENEDNVPTIITIVDDGDKRDNKNKKDNIISSKDHQIVEENNPANINVEKPEKETALLYCAPPEYTEPTLHEPCALHKNNLSSALPVDQSHEFVESIYKQNNLSTTSSSDNNNKHPVLYFTFISIHSSECVITPFIIYQILCGVCVPLKILVLKNVHNTSCNYSSNNTNKEKKTSDLQQHEKQQRQHQRALVEVCTINEAHDVIKYFDNIRVELMSPSVNKIQQYDGNTTTTSTHDNVDANVEMRFIIRVRLSNSRNEFRIAHNSSEEESQQHVTSGLQLRGNTMYSLELTNTNNQSIGPAFDRQYEYRVEPHRGINVAAAQSHNTSSSVQHTSVVSSYGQVNSNDDRLSEYNRNSNIIAPQFTAEVSSVKRSHTPQWSSHQSKSSRAHSHWSDHHSYSSFSSPSRSRSRSSSSSSFSQSSYLSTLSSSSSSATNSSIKPHKMKKWQSENVRQHHQDKHYKHNQKFLNERDYAKISQNDVNDESSTTIINDKSAHERKRQHTPSLSVMKYKRTRLHHGKDSNKHPGSLHNGESKNSKKYNDDISSPLGISHLSSSDHTAPLCNAAPAYPLHEPCETHVWNDSVLDVPQMYNNTERNLTNFDSVAALPANWRGVFSDEYQQVYYVYRDPVSGIESTTWTRPTT